MPVKTTTWKTALAAVSMPETAKTSTSSTSESMRVSRSPGSLRSKKDAGIDMMRRNSSERRERTTPSPPEARATWETQPLAIIATEMTA